MGKVEVVDKTNQEDGAYRCQLSTIPNILPRCSFKQGQFTAYSGAKDTD